MLAIQDDVLRDYDKAIASEWLETNGLGGWSSSSVIGCNTRRYHGLLVAAVNPPAERMSLVSGLDETIVCGDERFELSTHHYGDAIHPRGFQYLKQFSKDLFPSWLFSAGGVTIRKTISMVHGSNTVIIQYEILEAPGAFDLELLPLLSGRGYHALTHSNEAVSKTHEFTDGVFRTKLYEGNPDIYIHVPGGAFHPNPLWYYHFVYSIEQYRGLDFTEDLFSPGVFRIPLRKGDSINIVLSTANPTQFNIEEMLENEQSRRNNLIAHPAADENLRQLLLSADQFIVRRGESLKTIIAGYHWFTDWSRDTMIGLPGLCLSTGRFDDAKKILRAFAQSADRGMLPNRFQDNNEPPEYNTVDGTLWYFIAVHKYLEASGDTDFVLNEILPVLKDIIDWHFKGTRYNIHVDTDGLLYAGEKGQQLTWMDARIGDWVVTPRMGKAVEVQALWYNALEIFARLLLLNHQEWDAVQVISSSQKAKKSFLEKFWYEQGKYFYDTIDQDGLPTSELRPNQLFAISLPFPLVEGEQATQVLEAVKHALYTPAGLRTLPPSDPAYTPVYGGDAYHRDAAYHQGTAWSWLLGPYIDALIKVDGDYTRAKEVINAFVPHLQEACIGSISEIFDADAPHHPRGCIAQAWGVGEILRVLVDYRLLSSQDATRVQNATCNSSESTQTP